MFWLEDWLESIAGEVSLSSSELHWLLERRLGENPLGKHLLGAVTSKCTTENSFTQCKIRLWVQNQLPKIAFDCESMYLLPEEYDAGCYSYGKLSNLTR